MRATVKLPNVHKGRALQFPATICYWNSRLYSCICSHQSFLLQPHQDPERQDLECSWCRQGPTSSRYGATPFLVSLNLPVGNKIDLEKERQVPTAEGQALATEWGCAFVECSAKQNSNVGQIFTACLTEVEKAQGPPPAAQSDCVLL